MPPDLSSRLHTAAEGKGGGQDGPVVFVTSVDSLAGDRFEGRVGFDFNRLH
jgi:hypothetical protein